MVLDGAPAATVPLQGATPAGAEGGTLDDHASLPRRQEHLSYTTVPQLEGTTNVWELFLRFFHGLTWEPLASLLPLLLIWTSLDYHPHDSFVFSPWSGAVCTKLGHSTLHSPPLHLLTLPFLSTTVTTNHASPLPTIVC